MRMERRSHRASGKDGGKSGLIGEVRCDGVSGESCWRGSRGLGRRLLRGWKGGRRRDWEGRTEGRGLFWSGRGQMKTTLDALGLERARGGR